MPDTIQGTPNVVTNGELWRAVERIENGIAGISNKLDTKIDKVDQVRKDTEQDVAIKEVEAKIDKMIWSITATALTSVGGLLLAIANRGALG
jgi:hypothetical protein